MVPAAILERARKAARRNKQTMYVFLNYAGWHIDRRIPPFNAAYVAVHVDGTTDAVMSH